MIEVNSEIGLLKKVLVHRPDSGIARISPKRAEELLFDDIVHLPQMQKEHDRFTDVLKAFIGEENVLEVQTLLKESLEVDDHSRIEIVEKIVDYEEMSQKMISTLCALSNEKLAEVLITGYLEDEEHVFFDPIPNFIFTRDIAVSIKDHIIITKAAKEARYRENLLTRFFFYHHPMFDEMHKQNRIINLNHIDEFPPSKKGERVSIEGGDIMMMGNDFLLIGCSERTTEHAINSLMKVVFEKGLVNNVVQINIPNDRSCMHIDTLFTRISERDMVCFKPTVFDGILSNVIVHRKSGDRENYNSVRDFFWAEINRDARFIFSGDGESPFQEREQWTDGCNLVAIRPGVALTYDRNPHTEKAFKNAGYSVVHADQLLEEINKGLISPDQIKDTIITLSSSELSRARGGSHCMTCPILRESI
ncbi:MAG: arginine deiminase family protein [Saprospiraceae bacterium]